MPARDRLFVVVSGPPASGKTTIARPLAGELGLPLVRKDAIKEALGDAIGAADYQESRRLGAISLQVLRALMRDIGFGVYDSPWRAEFDLADLSRLPPPLVEVFCDCDPELRKERLRGRQGTRHPVHFDADLAGILADDPTARPLGGPWPLLRVDTSRPIVIAELAEQVRLAARSARR
ncbi:MAG: AAA family ATPase [Candidatus Dormibacteraeota bacterium]|nr:AAA family ATPase [Candidatus Dormibacteraeota bacterium]